MFIFNICWCILLLSLSAGVLNQHVMWSHPRVFYTSMVIKFKGKYLIWLIMAKILRLTKVIHKWICCLVWGSFCFWKIKDFGRHMGYRITENSFERITLIYPFVIVKNISQIKKRLTLILLELWNGRFAVYYNVSELECSLSLVECEWVLTQWVLTGTPLCVYRYSVSLACIILQCFFTWGYLERLHRKKLNGA